MPKRSISFKPYVMLGALFWLSFIIRPSSVLPMIPLLLLKTYESQSYSFIWNFMRALILTIQLFGLAVLLDSMFYGRLVLTSWNFFKVWNFKLIGEYSSRDCFLIWNRASVFSLDLLLALLFQAPHFIPACCDLSLLKSLPLFQTSSLSSCCFCILTCCIRIGSS